MSRWVQMRTKCAAAAVSSPRRSPALATTPTKSVGWTWRRDQVGAAMALRERVEQSAGMCDEVVCGNWPFFPTLLPPSLPPSLLAPSQHLYKGADGWEDWTAAFERNTEIRRLVVIREGVDGLEIEGMVRSHMIFM